MIVGILSSVLAVTVETGPARKYTAGVVTLGLGVTATIDTRKCAAINLAGPVTGPATTPVTAVDAANTVALAGLSQSANGIAMVFRVTPPYVRTAAKCSKCRLEGAWG